MTGLGLGNVALQDISVIKQGIAFSVQDNSSRRAIRCTGGDTCQHPGILLDPCPSFVITKQLDDMHIAALCLPKEAEHALIAMYTE